MTNTDPGLKLGSDGLFRLTSKSAAINGGVSSGEKDDMLGNLRDNKKDVGAEEFGGTKPNRHPLTPANVGPYWMIKK